MLRSKIHALVFGKTAVPTWANFQIHRAATYLANQLKELQALQTV